MNTINRQVVIIKPKEPFLAWLRSLPEPDPEGYTMDDLNHDATAYLIPNFDSEEESLQNVYENFEFFFSEELDAWWTEESDWPEKMDLNIFKEWFDIEIHSMVVDLLEEEIEKESL